MHRDLTYEEKENLPHHLHALPLVVVLTNWRLLTRCMLDRHGTLHLHLHAEEEPEVKQLQDHQSQVVLAPQGQVQCTQQARLAQHTALTA